MCVRRPAGQKHLRRAMLLGPESGGRGVALAQKSKPTTEAAWR